LHSLQAAAGIWDFRFWIFDYDRLTMQPYESEGADGKKK
jgi:hypothetical protein